MAAAAETAGTRRDLIMGNMRGVKADLTSIDNTDTWTPGLAIIEFFTFNPSAAAATTQWGATVSTPANRQAVVTFAIESGSLEGQVIAWGY